MKTIRLLVVFLIGLFSFVSFLSYLTVLETGETGAPWLLLAGVASAFLCWLLARRWELGDRHEKR